MNILGIWVLASIIFVSSITVFAFAQDESTSSTTVEKELILTAERHKPGHWKYTITVDGQIRPENIAFLRHNVISADGKTASWGFYAENKEKFYFTGNIVSITGEGHLTTIVDGIEVPNDSPPPITLAPGEKELLISNPEGHRYITFDVVVTGQIKVGFRGTLYRDFISPDGTTLNGDIWYEVLDGFIFSGDIVSFTTNGTLLATVYGVPIPYNDTSLSPTELSNTEEVQEKVSEVLEIENEQVQETVSQNVPTSSTTVEKELILTAERHKPAHWDYTITVDGQIRPANIPARHNVVSADGKTASWGFWAENKEKFYFTGNIVSITGEGHLTTTVDGIEVPNDSQPPITLAPGEKELLIWGDPNAEAYTTFDVIVTGQIKPSFRATTYRDFISPDGTTLNGDVLGDNIDGFIFSGDIVSFITNSSITATVDNVTVPYTDTSLSPTEQQAKIKEFKEYAILVNKNWHPIGSVEIEEKVSEVLEIENEQVQETVNQVQVNGISSGGSSVEKELIVTAKDRLKNGRWYFTVTVDGQIRPGPLANKYDAISSDGKTVNGETYWDGRHSFFFTGNIVSITGDGHLITTVDGIEVPNDSPPPITLAPGERELFIRGDENSVGYTNFEIIVTGQIKQGFKATPKRDIVSPDGTRVIGDVQEDNLDGFIFSGEIVSITTDFPIIATVGGCDRICDTIGVPVPYIDTSLFTTELSNSEVQEKVSEISEIESEQVQETVNQAAWLIPIIGATIGIGIVLSRKKTSKSRIKS